MPKPLRELLALVLSAALASACGTTGMLRGQEAEHTAARAAPASLPADARLDLEIVVFDPGLPGKGEEIPENVSPGIRKAEAYYLPCLLLATLQQSQQWGDVFLGPRESSAVDAYVLAEIVQSDGDHLVLEVLARDTTGREWLSERYHTEVTDRDYASSGDPYQRMFNTIANDLAAARDALLPDELRAIRTIAELRFAEDFSPDSFSGYVEADEDGVLRAVRLPAHEDPMVDRIREARARELMFIDTLGGHYEQMCSDMTASYLQWRGSSRSEAKLYSDAQRKRQASLIAIPIVIALTILGAMAAGDNGGALVAVAGGVAVQQLYVKAQEFGSEAKLHEGTLEQMHSSFESEVEPMVVETEGTTHRLTGNVDEQYAEWRRLLRELYAAESGVTEVTARIDRLPEDSEDALPQVGAPPPQASP
jgi:hypothetical protein